MAETIISVIAEGVLEKMGSISLSQISLAWGVKTDLKKLGKTLSTIKAVLLDAEEQQAKNHTVRDWLQKLKDVVYDMDDVLDEFSTEELRRKVEVHGSKLKEVSNFFSRSNPLAFRFKIGHKIKDIRERLDDIAADMRNFHFIERVVNTRVENQVREQTHSFVQESDIIGRDYDKENIVKRLLSSSDHESLSVIPIVGLGGLGKTTLVKLVYNDERIVQNFELKMWVCVSDDFDIKKLLEKIIESVPGANCGYRELDPLQRCLRDNLNAKKFLLVLDDVWNEDPKRWTELRDLLIYGANGSTIIVTTRSKKIASIMGTIPPYDLSLLPYDDCLSLFMRCAFREGHGNENSELVEVGKEIVRKCGGVPLAVKTLGSLLCMKTEVHEWLYIRDNDIWKLEQKENDILPALRLSYDQLPSYLKQCFAYCSIFPKDYEIDREELINSWLAQGFIQSLNGSQQLEDIGNRYFNELLSRSLFQEELVGFESEIYSCKMHDLVHDLARQVVGIEWLDVDCNSKIISESVRHVMFTKDDFFGKEFPTFLLREKKLRSFCFACKVGPISKSFVDTLILRFKCLRVLDLSYSEFEELPSFIGNLKHLRYLNLYENRSLKALPNSICKLLNLHTLYLNGCEQLQDLPKDIGKLISLRNLDLTSQVICLSEKGLQGLTSLRVLRLYRCNRLTSLSEGIQHLTSLKRLCIDECPSLASLPSGMKHLTALEKLNIWDCQELSLLEGEDMQGLRSLRSLKLIGLPKLVTLPEGLQQSAATLQYVNIQNCRGLTTLLGWLQTLSSLQILCIWDCPNLLSLPEGMQRLTALRKLVIKGCPHLNRRCKKETGEDWPKISHIPLIEFVDDEDLGQ